MTVNRAKQVNRFNFVYFPTTSPLTRVCPACDAAIGQACWDLKRELYPVSIKSFHPARRLDPNAPPPAEEPALFDQAAEVVEKPPRKVRTKRCSRCFEKLAIEEFDERVGRPGYNTFCRACVIEYDGAWRDRNTVTE